MGSVDHFFALSHPALVSALSKKIILQRELPDLGVEYLEIGFSGLCSRAAAKYIGC